MGEQSSDVETLVDSCFFLCYSKYYPSDMGIPGKPAQNNCNYTSKVTQPKSKLNQPEVTP